MYSYRIWIFCLILSVSGGTSPLDGFFSWDDTYAGTTTLAFLKMPVTARDLSLGGNTAAISEEASAVFYNPALLATNDRYRGSFSHAEIFGELRHEYGGVSIPGVFGGNLGISINALLPRDFLNVADENEDAVDIFAAEGALGLSWARTLIPSQFDMGLEVKALSGILDDADGFGYAVSVGGLGYLQEDFRIGFSLNNISHGFRWGGSGTGELEKLPMTFRFDLMRHHGDLRNYNWHIGYAKGNDALHTLNAGWEQIIFPWWKLRAGWNWAIHDQENSWQRGLSGGTGFQFHSLTLDYGFRWESDLGIQQMLSLHFSRPVPRPTATELLKLAGEHLESGECEKATHLAEQLMDTVRVRSRAAYIMQECHLREVITSGRYFVLLYTGGTQGVLEPTLKEDAIRGGVSRRKTLLDSLTVQYPQSLVVDAGEQLSGVPSQDSVVSKIWAHLPYDIVYADTGLRPGSEQTPLIPSQTKHLKAGEAWNGTIGSQRIAVFADSCPSMKGAELHFCLSQKSVLELNRQQSVESSKGWSFWISGAPEQALFQPMETGSGNRILATGSDAWVGMLFFDLSASNKRGKLGRWFHRLIPVDAAIEPDSTIAKLSGESRLKNVERDNLFPVNRLEYSQFLFTGAPDTGMIRDIYIKDTRRNFNIRLTKRPGKYKSPELAHTRSLFAWREVNGLNASLWLQSTQSKDKQQVSLPEESVVDFKWGPRENWIYYLTQNNEGSVLRAVHASGQLRKVVHKFPFQRVRNIEMAYTRDLAFIEVLEGERSTLHRVDLLTGSGRAISPDSISVESVKVSPDGRWLSWVERDVRTALNRAPQIRIRDLSTHDSKTFPVAISVRGMAWGGDSQHLVYASGLNLTDLNVLNIETGEVIKTASFPRNEIWREAGPVAYRYQEQPGVLFERSTQAGSFIYWVDLKKGKVHSLVKQSGFFHLSP